MSKEPEKKSIISSDNGGLIQEVLRQIKLIWLLLTDKRVNIFLKSLPIMAFAYLIFPFDIAPGIALPIIGVLDDAAVVWIGTSLFVSLSPEDVVEEHMNSLKNMVNSSFRDIPDADVVDAEARDITDSPKS